MSKRAHIVVVGNEKGGVGKSTTAMHLTVGFLRKGLEVVTVDLDARQASFTRYVENRQNFSTAIGAELPFPIHHVVHPSASFSLDEAQKDEEDRFGEILDLHMGAADIIIVDCPGADSYLSRLGHLCADTLVTPLNDSFVDLDILANIDRDNLKMTRPSHYSDLVWENRKLRASQGQRAVDWIVFRNRLSNLFARNKKDMETVLTEISERLNFKVIDGLSERVVFRELFLKGLTLFDLKDVKQIKMTLSHVAAKQEIMALMDAVEASMATATTQSKTEAQTIRAMEFVQDNAPEATTKTAINEE